MEELIDKFWQGKCSLEERKFLLQNLEDPSQLERDALNKYNTIVSDPKGKDYVYYNDLFLRIKGQIEVGHEQGKPKYLYRLYSLTAAAIVVITSTFLFFGQKKESTQKINHSVTLINKVITESNTTLTDKSILLKDGSIVKIRPGSSISYTSTYNLKERNLTLLKGEAYFKVIKQKNKPFTVNSSDVLTTALGTTFTISKTALNKVEIKLLEGKVVVRSVRKKKQYFIDTYLIPGQTLVANLDYGRFVLKNTINKAVTVPKVPARIKKKYPDLIFEKELLSNVFQSLEQRYNVHIEYIIDPDSSLSFTGSVKSGESLNDILSTICALNNLSYAKESNQIIISKK